MTVQSKSKSCLEKGLIFIVQTQRHLKAQKNQDSWLRDIYCSFEKLLCFSLQYPDFMSDLALKLTRIFLQNVQARVIHYVLVLCNQTTEGRSLQCNGFKSCIIFAQMLNYSITRVQRFFSIALFKFSNDFLDSSFLLFQYTLP